MNIGHMTIRTRAPGALQSGQAATGNFFETEISKIRKFISYKGGQKLLPLETDVDLIKFMTSP